MHIFLIDDTPEHLDLLMEFVRELRPGATVHCIHNGLELPTWLASQPADLVMMDLMMPAISGFELVRQIRQVDQWATLPIVAVSGLRQPEQAQALQSAGFTDFIVKPYELDDLSRVLDSHLPD